MGVAHVRRPNTAYCKDDGVVVDLLSSSLQSVEAPSKSSSGARTGQSRLVSRGPISTVTPASLESSDNEMEDEPQMLSPNHRDPRLRETKRTIYKSLRVTPCGHQYTDVAITFSVSTSTH